MRGASARVRKGKGPNLLAPTDIVPRKGKDERHPETTSSTTEFIGITLECGMLSNPIHSLRDSFVLDTGATTHICNSDNRLSDLHEKEGLGYLLAGRESIPLSRVGDVKLRLDSFNETILMGGHLNLRETRFVPGFPTSLVSLDLLEDHRYYLDSEIHCLFWKSPEGSRHNVIFLQKKYGLYVIEYNDVKDRGMSMSTLHSSYKKRKRCLSPCVGEGITVESPEALTTAALLPTSRTQYYG